MLESTLGKSWATFRGKPYNEPSQVLDADIQKLKQNLV